MALVGNFIQKKSVLVDGETEEIKIEYPSDLPKDHIYYNKRGTTETNIIPKQITENVVFNDVYLYIKAISIWQPNIETLGKFLVNITYEIFSSKEEREKDPKNFIIQDAEISSPIDINKDVMDQCYQIIKSKNILENIQNI